MKSKLFKTASILFTFLLVFNSKLSAHCDGLDGPVVKAAIKSLETGDLNFSLIWVKKDFEKELNQVFQKTLAVRTLSPEAKELSDNYYYETIVRLHRMGEGEPFTGLKPAGRDLGPAIPAADLAVQTGSLQELPKLLPPSSHEKLIQLFENVMRAKNFETYDIEAGREYVEAYVHFIHYTELQYGDRTFEKESRSHKHEL